MVKKSFPLSNVYTLLGSGPVIVVTAAYKDKQNIMPMAWHTMLDFDPPLVGVVIGETNYTFALLKRTRECVIGIPTADIAGKVIACGHIHGDKINKFEKVGLTPRTASFVKAPLVDECYANFECKVVDTRMVNTYNFFVLEVIKAWVDPTVKDPRTFHHLGKDHFMTASKRIRIRPKIK